MSKEDLQKKYLELQILEQQLSQLQQQSQILHQQIQELSFLSEAIDGVSKVKKDTEMLIPLGAGVYAKGELKDNKEVIMNVGANTTTVKSTKEARVIIEDQISQLKNMLDQIALELNKANIAGHDLQHEIQQEVAKNKA
ncbi:MAG: prefoldin subunit alpha [Candidatus Nanoarchaeia archaeon]|nr:prefoldin subunit alpha [Candidatus Nanoarchaeia archaeon]